MNENELRKELYSLVDRFRSFQEDIIKEIEDIFDEVAEISPHVRKAFEAIRDEYASFHEDVKLEKYIKRVFSKITGETL